MTRSLHPSEDQIHVSVAQWLDLTYPQTPKDVRKHGVCWTTIEHRNARGAAEGARRKARGVKPGIPDLDFIFEYRSYRVELKDHDGVLSADQKDMRAKIMAAGGQWALCRSLEAVIDQLGHWGFPQGARRVAM